jgi:hypothetical protein
MLYKKSRNACIYLAWFLILAGTIIICIIVSKFDLTAGAYTLENWYMYGKYLNKPYCKLQVHAIGILFCILYLELLKYRKLEKIDPEEAKKQYPKIALLKRSTVVGKSGMFFGLTLILINLFISYFCS